MRLILIRHGQTPANVLGSLDTAEPGPGLTELGHSQAALLPERLLHDRVDTVYVSSLIRTHLTAAPLLADRGLDRVERRGLRELAAGDWEGRSDAEAVADFFGVLQSWRLGDLDRRMPGGETGQEVLDRYEEVVDEAVASGSESSVIVSHGGVIRLWAAERADNVDLDDPRVGHLGNTGVVVMNRIATGWTCEFWGDDYRSVPSA